MKEVTNIIIIKSLRNFLWKDSGRSFMCLNDFEYITNFENRIKKKKIQPVCLKNFKIIVV